MKERCTAAALIRISRFLESPERAVKSVLRMRQVDCSEIIIVSQVATDKTQLYNGWDADKKEMAKRKIELRFELVFNLNNVNSQLLIELPATCQIKDRGEIFQRTLVDRVKKTKKYQRYAWDIKTDFSNAGFSPWYIFLCVVFVVDW
jgi:hypothetical protein